MPPNNRYVVTFTLDASLSQHEAEEWASELTREAASHLYPQDGEQLKLVSVELTVGVTRPDDSLA